MSCLVPQRSQFRREVLEKRAAEMQRSNVRRAALVKCAAGRLGRIGSAAGNVMKRYGQLLLGGKSATLAPYYLDRRALVGGWAPQAPYTQRAGDLGRQYFSWLRGEPGRARFGDSAVPGEPESVTHLRSVWHGATSEMRKALATQVGTVGTLGAGYLAWQRHKERTRPKSFIEYFLNYSP